MRVVFSEWLPGSFLNYSAIKLCMEFVVELSLIGGLQREKQVECSEHKGSHCGRGNGVTDGTKQQKSVPSVSQARSQNKGCSPF